MRRNFESREDLQDYLWSEFPAAEGGLSPIRGGAEAAESALAELDEAQYAATRNFLNGAVSRLSPYIRHGLLAIADLRRRFPTPKFIQELAWRDYFQRVYWQIGEGVWEDREAWKTGLSAADYADCLPEDVVGGRTGLACMDAFVAELVTTGYLHNHARMWFASYVIHTRRVKWQAGARFFLMHLVDGDPASNNLSWQWVASTFSAKPYLFDRENLERFSDGVYCGVCPVRRSCPFESGYGQHA